MNVQVITSMNKDPPLRADDEEEELWRMFA